MEGILGGMANAGLTWLFQQFGEWLYQWVYDAFSRFAEEVLKLATTTTGVFWDVPAIAVLLDFSGWINMAVLAVSLLMLCMDITEQNGRVNWMIVFSNLCKGLVFVLFNRYIGLATYAIAEETTQALKVDMQPPSQEMLHTLFASQTSGVFIILMLLVIVAAFIAFFVMAMLRNGTLFVQIFSSSFYIPAIVRGDTAKLGDWFKRTVAISATYFVQYVLFYLGLNFMTEMSGTAFVTTATCWLTMFFVPKVLEQFGYSSGAANVLSAAGSIAGAGMGLVK